jgi:hypothetical protein
MKRLYLSLVLFFSIPYAAIAMESGPLEYKESDNGTSYRAKYIPWPKAKTLIPATAGVAQGLGNYGSDFVYNKIHPWQDPSNLIFFELSEQNQLAKFGQEPLSLEDQSYSAEIFEKAGRSSHLLLQMNKETAARNPDAVVISTRYGTWINPSKWSCLPPTERRRIMAQQANIPYDYTLFKNSAKICIYSAGAGLGLYGLAKLSRHPKSRTAHFIGAGLSGATILHNMGVTKDLAKLWHYKGDRIPLSAEEQYEIEQKAGRLLSSLENSVKPTTN